MGRPVSFIIPPGLPDDTSTILDKIRRGERVDHYETVRRRIDEARVDQIAAEEAADDDFAALEAAAMKRGAIEENFGVGECLVICDHDCFLWSVGGAAAAMRERPAL